MGLRQIPIDPAPDTSQQTELDGVTYSFRFRWSERAACWHMDLRTLEGAAIATSVRLVSGFPLLRRVVGPAAPPGELYCIDQTGQDEDPTLDGLGSRFGLFYVEASGAYG
jgi:hypothetical protein